VAHDWVIRELADGDLPAVVRLCGEALDLAEDAVEAEAIVTRLRTSGGSRRTVGFVATTTATGAAAVTGVVLGSLGARDPEAGHVDLLAVHPARRRRGVARALMAAAEGALGRRGARQILLTGNAPYYAWPGIDVRYTPAVCAARALGYDHHDTAWNMTADLSDGSPAVRDTAPAEERLAAAGVTVRPATEADAAALATLARANFGSSWGAEIADSIGRPGAGCHIAVRDVDGQPLGFAAYGSSRPSWFGPMGTVEAAQGLGIGGVLLRRCLIDQRAAGLARAEIGWVGPVAFYSSAVDARIERVFFLFRKRLERPGWS
jgi:predicted N-acetyltransferase YhbS